MCVARHDQITQNNKEVSDKVDFLHADKHESLLHDFDWDIKHSQRSQNSKFGMCL